MDLCSNLSEPIVSSPEMKDPKDLTRRAIRMSEEERPTNIHEEQPRARPQYSTFPAVATGYPLPTAVGLPQHVLPPGFVHGFPQPLQPRYFIQSGRVVGAIPIAIGRPARLPCCGIGYGWFLFIIGFLLDAIPWYVGALILVFSRPDPRETPGYMACAIAAILTTIAIIFGLIRFD